jgi:hypothetical protein
MPKTRGPAPTVAPGETMEQMREQSALDSYKAAYELSQRVQALGGAARASLARRSPEGEWSHLRSFPASSFDLDRLADEYGGGHFRVQVFGTREDGSKGWIEGVGGVFDIEGEAILIRRGEVPVKDEPARESGAEKVLAVLMQQNANMMQLLLAAIQGMRPQPSEGSDPLKVVELAQKIAGFGTNAIAPEQYIKDRADSYDAGFNKGVDIGTREGRRGDSDPGWPGVVRDLAGPAFEAIRAAAPALQPPSLQARIALMQDSPQARIAPAGQEVHVVNEPTWFRGLKPWLPMIGFAAQNKMAPAKAAGLVMDQISDDEYEAFADDVLGPDFAARMTPLLPAVLVQRFPEWVSQTLSAIRAAVEEEQAEAGPVGLGEGDEPVGGEIGEGGVGPEGA